MELQERGGVSLLLHKQCRICSGTGSARNRDDRVISRGGAILELAAGDDRRVDLDGSSAARIRDGLRYRKLHQVLAPAIHVVRTARVDFEATSNGELVGGGQREAGSCPTVSDQARSGLAGTVHAPGSCVGSHGDTGNLFRTSEGEPGILADDAFEVRLGLVGLEQRLGQANKVLLKFRRPNDSAVLIRCQQFVQRGACPVVGAGRGRKSSGRADEVGGCGLNELLQIGFDLIRNHDAHRT